jgi:hypothetical protein
MTAGAKAVAAAYQLQREGKRVTVAAAARLAVVNRTNLYTDQKAVQIIKKIKAPERSVRSGHKDRSGRLEAHDG